jgi:hypothetical protein
VNPGTLKGIIQTLDVLKKVMFTKPKCNGSTHNGKEKKLGFYGTPTQLTVEWTGQQQVNSNWTS